VQKNHQNLGAVSQKRLLGSVNYNVDMPSLICIVLGFLQKPPQVLLPVFGALRNAKYRYVWVDERADTDTWCLPMPFSAGL
jgi:hypothetical protein